MQILINSNYVYKIYRLEVSTTHHKFFKTSEQLQQNCFSKAFSQ
jgi:hypothetical protein